ncbi:unnamed protein product [Trichogramma brassicae]|uniref:RING-type domain-containing protein n=1 Tax=Trichogramma brassicae TaxID=86971 RepID=A0A6H5I593_9HYME|nr:unnamed protein product [Trichogramma brassicae]
MLHYTRSRPLSRVVEGREDTSRFRFEQTLLLHTLWSRGRHIRGASSTVNMMNALRDAAEHLKKKKNETAELVEEQEVEEEPEIEKEQEIEEEQEVEEDDEDDEEENPPTQRELVEFFKTNFKTHPGPVFENPALAGGGTSRGNSAAAGRRSGTAASRENSTAASRGNSAAAGRRTGTAASRGNGAAAGRNRGARASRGNSTAASRGDSAAAGRRTGTVASRGNGAAAGRNRGARASQARGGGANRGNSAAGRGKSAANRGRGVVERGRGASTPANSRGGKRRLLPTEAEHLEYRDSDEDEFLRASRTRFDTFRNFLRIKKSREIQREQPVRPERSEKLEILRARPILSSIVGSVTADLLEFLKSLTGTVVYRRCQVDLLSLANKTRAFCSCRWTDASGYRVTRTLHDSRARKATSTYRHSKFYRKASLGRHSHLVHRVGDPGGEIAKTVRFPRRKSSPGRYSCVVHRVCHLGERSIENSLTSSEKVVAGSIFIHGLPCMSPGWTKYRKQLDFLGESRRRVDILTWCTEYVTRVDEEAKPVRLPRRKSSPGRYSYVVQRVGHPGGRRSETSSTSSEIVVAGSIFLRGATSMSPGWTKKRNQFDFLGESRRRVDILTWCTEYVTRVDEEAKPVRLPRRKSSPGRYSYLVHRDFTELRYLLSNSNESEKEFSRAAKNASALYIRSVSAAALSAILARASASALLDRCDLLSELMNKYAQDYVRFNSGKQPLPSLKVDDTEWKAKVAHIEERLKGNEVSVRDFIQFIGFSRRVDFCRLRDLELMPMPENANAQVARRQVARRGGRSNPVVNIGRETAQVARRGGRTAQVARRGGRSNPVVNIGRETAQVARRGGRTAQVARRGGRSNPVVNIGRETAQVARRGGRTAQVARRGGRSNPVANIGREIAQVATREYTTPQVARRGGRTAQVAHWGQRSNSVANINLETVPISTRQYSTPQVARRGGGMTRSATRNSPRPVTLEFQQRHAIDQHLISAFVRIERLERDAPPAPVVEEVEVQCLLCESKSRVQKLRPCGHRMCVPCIISLLRKTCPSSKLKSV